MTGRHMGLAVLLMLASCAAPPVTLYTLNGAGQAGQAGPAVPLARSPVVIVLPRVTLPDYLDTQDLLIRRGTVVERSHLGRWASRLSVGATEQLTARLAGRRPDALVTDQPQTTTPSYRIVINLSRLDLATQAGPDGTATLDADWLIIPRDPAAPTRRGRTHLVASGPMRDDRDAVALTAAVLDRLAASIDVTSLR